MKRILCLIIAVCVLTLAGCNLGGTAVKNEEFEEYAQQIISVMHDLGVIDSVPDFTTGATASVDSPALLSFGGGNTFNENGAEIFELLDAAEKTECEALSAVTDVFEQTFFIPLIMGDALAANYGVSRFYGVCANTPWNQYVSTEKYGDKKTTSVYTPASSGVFDKETFITMSLTFLGDENYVVESVQLSVDFSSLMYFYVDSDGEFFTFSYESDNTQNCYATYGRSLALGYTVTDTELLLEIKSNLMGEFESVDFGYIRSIKENSRYTVDEDKWNAAQAKYFNSDSGKLEASPYVWADAECTVLAGFICREDVETLVIPPEAKYLMDRFFISSEGGRVRSLYIPNTVLGVKSYAEPDDNTDSVIAFADASPSSFVLDVEWHEPLENITVQSESSLFCAGDGHLTTLSGDIVCYVDAPHPTGVIDAFALIRRGDMFFTEIDKYPILAASITEIVYNNTDGNVDGDFNILIERLPSLKKINYSSPNGGGVSVRVANDVEIVIDAPGRISVRVDTVRRAEEDENGNKPTVGSLKLTLTILRPDNTLDLQTDISPQNITLNLPWSEGYYRFMKEQGNDVLSGLDTALVNANFTQDDEALDMTGITLERIGDDDFLAILDSSLSKSFVIPADYYGYAVSRVYLQNFTTEQVSVTLPKTVTDFSIGGSSNANGYSSNVTVNYAGSKTEFDGIVSEFRENECFAVYLASLDFEGYYKNRVIEISFCGNTALAPVYLTADGYVFELYSPLLVESFSESVFRYYYTDEYGNEYTVKIAGYPTDRHIEGKFESYDDVRDLVLTYHEQLTPDYEMPNPPDKK